MGYYYAQLNTDNIVKAVSELYKEIQRADMIPIGFLDNSLLGKKYEGGEFIDVLKPILKTVYSRSDFIALLPKTKLREIQAAAATDNDINAWLFNLQMADKIDLNSLPDWFIEGMDALPGATSITQAQVDAFLERELS